MKTNNARIIKTKNYKWWTPCIFILLYRVRDTWYSKSARASHIAGEGEILKHLGFSSLVFIIIYALFTVSKSHIDETKPEKTHTRKNERMKYDFFRKWSEGRH